MVIIGFIIRKTKSIFLRVYKQYKTYFNIYDHKLDLKRDLRLNHTIMKENGKHTFFGYYDINPFNNDGTKLLATCVDLELATPIPGRLMDVGYFDLIQDKPKFNLVGETETWCWQQGCRLQWYPHNSDNLIFYNVLQNDHYASIVQDIERREIVKQIDYPIYDLAKTGNWGLSLNFSRLQRLRPGYGYTCLSDGTINEFCPETDGVFLVDLEKNKQHLLFSLSEMAKISPHASMKDAQHYVNHLSINPSGSHFIFLHLWVSPQNKRYSRMFAASVNGKELKLMVDVGTSSHYAWLDDERFLNFIPIDSNSNSRYVLFNLNFGFEKIIGLNHLIADGHPSFFKKPNYLLTDTYPDNNRQQNLLLFDQKNNMLTRIGSYYSPPIFRGEIRCDLHPRISLNNNNICIDTIDNDVRVMKVLDISSYISDKI